LRILNFRLFCTYNRKSAALQKSEFDADGIGLDESTKGNLQAEHRVPINLVIPGKPNPSI